MTNVVSAPQFPELGTHIVTVLRRLAKPSVVILFAMVANTLPADLAVYEKACSAT